MDQRNRQRPVQERNSLGADGRRCNVDAAEEVPDQHSDHPFPPHLPLHKKLRSSLPREPRQPGGRVGAEDANLSSRQDPQHQQILNACRCFV